MDIQPPTCNPLTDEHCQLLDVALMGCSTQDELLGKCKQAGMPGLDGYIRDNNRKRQMAQALKAAFFPDRP
jgi:hypothetical protein